MFEDTDLWVRLAIVGQFAFLRRRTVVRNDTDGSLMARAATSGTYLAALELHGDKLAELLARTPGAEWLAPRARGTAVLGRALRQLDPGSEGRLGPLLARACGLQPELHEQARLMIFRVVRHVPSVTDAGAEARACLRCANAWPEPTAVTAHWLRAHALVAAARAGQPALCAAALRGWCPAGFTRCVWHMTCHLPWRVLESLQRFSARRGRARTPR